MPRPEESQQGAQQPKRATNPLFRRVLLVGLGGTGQDIVLRVKRRFMDSYKVVPPCVKFLCLDTDVQTKSLRSNVSSRVYDLDPQEYMHIKVPEPEVFVAQNKVVQKWFVKPVPVGAISAGAGAIRQNGRLALFFHINAVSKRLESLKNELTAGGLKQDMQNASSTGSSTDFRLSDKPMEIYVCGSLAGGTGSGAVIDIGILLRKEFPKALIHGFFLLDWLYRRNAFSYRVGGNTYAALAELDNLQSIMYGTAGFVPYQVDYGAGKVLDVEHPPFSLVNLIDGRNQNGENFDDRALVQDTVADAIFLSVGELGPAISSVVDNLLAHINVASPRVWDGKYARYSSLGVSSIVYPAKEFHRLLAAEKAVELCQDAVAEIEQGGTAETGGASGASSQTQSEVGNLLKECGYPGTPIEAAVRPKVRDFSLLPFGSAELTDGTFPANLKQKLMALEKQVTKAVDNVYQSAGAPIVGRLQTALKQAFTNLESQKPGAAALRSWVNETVSQLDQCRDGAVSAEQAAAEKLDGARATAEAQLKNAGGASYYAVVGGPRKAASETWRLQVNGAVQPALRDHLLAQKARLALDSVITQVKQLAPASVPKTSDVVRLLQETKAALQQEAADAAHAYDQLVNCTTNIVVGRGSFVIDAEFRTSLAEAGEASASWAQAGFSRMSTGDIHLRLDRWKSEAEIQTADDYQRAGGVEGLRRRFLKYASERLADLLEIDIRTAMQRAAENEGCKTDEYIREQFIELLRLGAPLWNYTEAKLDAVRQPHYERIINIGVPDDAEDRKHYDPLVREAKARFSIGVDHAYTTLGDKQRIWLLCYAAALPAYLVEAIGENRGSYEEEFFPTYHIDPRLEQEVPDLFPSNMKENVALRVLGMAIVRDIDVVFDQKLEKGQGHKFTCSEPEVTQLNLGDKKIWRLFREMYQDVCTSDELRAAVTDALKRRVGEMTMDDTGFSPGDVKDAKRLLRDLKEAKTEARRQLLEQLPNIRDLIATLDAKSVPLGDMVQGIAKELDAIARQGRCVLGEDLLRRPDMSRDHNTKALLARAGDLTADELRKLNRRLIQEALADGLRKSLRTAIESHVYTLKEKLAARDFTRLISARLTYREISDLERFLVPAGRGGYGLDLQRYIDG